MLRTQNPWGIQWLSNQEQQKTIENSNYPHLLIKQSFESSDAKITLVISLPTHSTRIKPENFIINSWES